MRITWTNHPYDKNKNGVTEHCPRSVVESAITFNQGIIPPRPRYGTPEWLAERAEAAKTAVPDKNDVLTPFIEGNKWGLITEPHTGRQVLVLEHGFEKTFFPTAEQALAHGCPKNIAAQFIPEARRQSNREAAIENDQQRHLAAEAQAKKDNSRAKIMLAVAGLNV